jgi:hypothetical protein
MGNFALFNPILKAIINPATKYIKGVIPAQAGIQQ